MKNLTLFLGLALLCPVLNAQVITATNPVTTSYEDEMASVFSSFNTSQVTSGLLLDKGYQLAPLEKFNGTASSSPCDLTLWKTTYLSLFTAQLQNSMADPDLTIKGYGVQPTGSMPIQIGLLYFKAHRFKKDAYTNGEVNIVSNKLVNISGKNPFEPLTIFASSPLVYKISGDRSQMIIHNSQFYTNQSGVVINSLQVDWDDIGYQSAALNQAFTASWREPGQKIIKVKAVFSNGETLISSSIINVEFSNAIYPNPADLTHVIPATNSHSGGTLSISYGCGSNGKINKPLIIVEGFDPVLDGEESTNYASFLLKTRQNVGVNFLDNQLQEGGYDYIYLNYNNGTDDINRNAALLQEAIEWINLQKAQSGSTEKNVVLGESMGGLVARVALRNMELAGRNHQTGKYISFDSPQNGANIPLGIQYMLAHLYNLETCVKLPWFLGGKKCITLREFAPELQDGINLLNSPAARQMLIYRANQANISSSLYQTFQTQLGTLGMPQNTDENISLTNGSIDAVTYDGFNSGGPLVDFSLTRDQAINAFVADHKGWVKLAADVLGVVGSVLFQVNALPEYSNSNATIYIGEIKGKIFWIPIFWSGMHITASQVQPLDNSPAGLYSVAPLLGEVANGAPAIFQNAIKLSAFSFIPVPSSAGLTGANQLNVKLSLRNGNASLTGFDKIIGPTYPEFSSDNNEEHTDISLGTADFLKEELIGEDQGFPLTNNLLTSSTYNFGRNNNHSTTERIFRKITVSGTGVLGINAGSNIGYTANNYGVPTSNSTVNVVLAPNCNNANTVLEIGNGGQLILGDLNLGTKGNLVVKSGTTLRLKSGSSLKINNSTLTVDFGASLLIEPGCKIEVNGSNAQFLIGVEPLNTALTGTIEISGQGLVRFYTLNLLDNQSLKISGSATTSAITCNFNPLAKLVLNGSNTVFEITNQLNLTPGVDFTFSSDAGQIAGFIRLKFPSGGTAITGGAASKLTLNGTGKTDKILEIIGQPEIMATNGLSRITLSNGLVVFDKGSDFIDFDVPATLTNCHFYNPQESDLNKGIITRGQAGLTISDCTFENIHFYGELAYGGFPLKMDNCTFSGHSKLYTWKKSVLLSNTTLKDGAIFIQDATDFTSYITGLTSKSTDLGNSHIDVQSTPNVVMRSINFDGAHQPAAFSGAGTVKLSCSRFVNNGYSVFELKNSRLDMGGLSGSGRNYIDAKNMEQAQIFDLISASTEVLLNNGGNALLSNYQDANALSYSGGAFVMPPSYTCGRYEYENAIVANGNQWFSDLPTRRPEYTTDPGFIVKLKCSAGYTQTEGFIQDNSPKAFRACLTIPTAPVATPAVIPELVKCPTCPVINSNDFVATRLNDAVSIAMGFLSDDQTVRQDAKALNLTKQILSSKALISGSRFDEYTTEAFEIAKTAYGNLMIRREADNMAKEDYRAVLNLMGSNSVANSSYTRAFALELTKYDFLRGQQAFIAARQVLDNLSCGVSSADEVLVNYMAKDLDLEIAVVTNINYSRQLLCTRRTQIKSEYQQALGSVLNNEPSEEHFTPVYLNSINTVQTEPCATQAIKISQAPAAEQTVNKDVLSNKVSLYPNPAKNEFTFFQSGNSIKIISVTDILGKGVLRLNLANTIGEQTINISSLVPGIYAIDCIDESGRVQKTKRLVVD